MKKICVYILSVLMFFAFNLPILAQTVNENPKFTDSIEVFYKKTPLNNKLELFYTGYKLTCLNQSSSEIVILDIKNEIVYSNADLIERVNNNEQLKDALRLLLISPVFVVAGAVTIVPFSILSIPSWIESNKDSTGFMQALPFMSLAGIVSPVIFLGMTGNESFKLVKTHIIGIENYILSKEKQKYLSYKKLSDIKIKPNKDFQIYILGAKDKETIVDIRFQDTKTQKIYTKTILLKP